MPNLIENNAYRILGLNAAASQTDVLRRYKEIINRLKIEDYPTYDIDINLPKNYRNEESVKDALKELQSQKNNIKEYFFWFKVSNANDKKALNYAIEKDFSKAIRTWKDLTKNDNVTSFFYKKNLAVLYCLLLLKEDNPKYLKDSLSIWDEIVRSEKFWTAFSKIYSDQNEQTASQENILLFKTAVIEEISDIYTDFGQIHKNSEYVKGFQEIFQTYGKSTEKNLLQPTYHAINVKIAELKEIKITKDDPKIERKIAEIKTIIEFIKIYLDRLNKNGLYDAPESKVIRDHIAEAIRSKSVDIHNNVGIYEEASKLLKVAVNISGTESYKSTLEDDEGKIKNSIEADKNSIVSIKISGIFSSKYAEFKPRFVEYDGLKMLYKDVTGISYNAIKRNYSITYYFTLYKNDSQISLSFSDQDAYSKVVGLAYQLIMPLIVKRYVDRIFENNEVITIGGIEFCKEGYTRSKFWGETESVSWKETIYTPKLSAGYVFLFKEKNGVGKSFPGVPMVTENAVIFPMLVHECLNRAVALGLIPPKIAPAPATQLQQNNINPNLPPDGSRTWQEYYDKIDRAQRPELLKAFEESGGKDMPKSWIEALKTIKSKEFTYNIDKDIKKQLIAKGYIREEKGALSTKYVIEKKGFNILNWVSYKYK